MYDNTAKKLSRHKIFADLRDTKFEHFDDIDNMLGVEYEGVASDSESIEDYSIRLFLFIEV